jgi:hypothetical protein
MPCDVNNILCLPLGGRRPEDQLVWRGIAGIYSVQSGYYKVYGKKFRAEIVIEARVGGG